MRIDLKKEIKVVRSWGMSDLLPRLDLQNLTSTHARPKNWSEYLKWRTQILHLLVRLDPRSSVEELELDSIFFEDDWHLGVEAIQEQVRYHLNVKRKMGKVK